VAPIAQIPWVDAWTLLSVVGLTGAILVFHAELDGWLNPDLFHVVPPAGAVHRSPDEIIASARAAAPENATIGLPVFPADANRAYAFNMTINGRTEDDEWRVFVNPYTAEIADKRLERAAGAPLPRAFIPFLFNLHYSLLLPARFGRPLAGYVALALLVSAVTGSGRRFCIRDRRLAGLGGSLCS
jgi:uncharacterized iron-regulated membrane protein